MKYFDANRNTNPITDIVSVAATSEVSEGCDSERKAEDGWERLTNLTSWRGIEAGCLEGTKVLKNNCKKVGKNGVEIPALEPVVLNRWKGDE